MPCSRKEGRMKRKPRLSHRNPEGNKRAAGGLPFLQVAAALVHRLTPGRESLEAALPIDAAQEDDFPPVATAHHVVV